MKAIAIAALLWVGLGVAQANEMQDAAIGDAELWGAALYQAYIDKADQKLKSFANYKDLKQFAKESGCSGYKYKAYVLELGDESRFYLVGTRSKNVIVGRHFRGTVQEGAVVLTELVSSTNSCLNLGRKPRDAVAMFATHLQPYPNEFHVLESLMHEVTLYIGTSAGNWKIEAGKISLLADNDDS